MEARGCNKHTEAVSDFVFIWKLLERPWVLLQEVSGKVNNTSPTVWLLCAVRTVQLSLAYKNILGSWLPLYLREFGTTNTAARNVGESFDSRCENCATFVSFPKPNGRWPRMCKKCASSWDPRCKKRCNCFASNTNVYDCGSVRIEQKHKTSKILCFFKKRDTRNFVWHPK